MNIGILGANGFLGRNLCKRYLEDGFNVYAYYHNHYSSIPKGCNTIKAGNWKESVLDYLFVTVGGHASTYKDFLLQYDLIKKAIDDLCIKRVVYISSIAVYGTHSTPISINSSYNNPSIYGLSKLSQEFLIKSFDSFSIIRPTYVYGRGMNKNSFIPRITESAIIKKEITILGQGKRKNDYLHVDDLINLCVLSASHNENFTIIAATGNAVSNTLIAEEIKSNIRGTTVSYVGDDNSPSFEFDITDTVLKTGFNPQIELRQGIKEYISSCQY